MSSYRLWRKPHLWQSHLHVPQPIHEKLRSINPNNWAYCVSNDCASHVMKNSAIERMQHLGLTGDCWIVGEVDNNDQYLVPHDCVLGSSWSGWSYAEYLGYHEGRQDHSCRSRSDPRLFVGPSSHSRYTSSPATTNYRHRLKVRTHRCENNNLYRCLVSYSAIGMSFHYEMDPR